MSDQDRSERPFADEPDDRPPTGRERLSAGPGRAVEGDEGAALPASPAAEDTTSTLLLVGGVFVGVFVVALAATNGFSGAKPTTPTATAPTSVATTSPPRKRFAVHRPLTPEEQRDIDEANAEAGRQIQDWKNEKTIPRSAPSDKDVNGLFADLTNTDDETARSAAEGLARKDTRRVASAMRREIVFALIREGLKPNRLAPATLRAALVVWATGEDLTPLAALVKNPNADLRGVGVSVVAGLRDPRAASLLVAALEFDGNRSEASAALKRIGAPCETAVWKSLTSSNPRVRQEACAILGVVGSNDSVTHLQDRTFEEDQGVRAEAESAIAAIAMR